MGELRNELVWSHSRGRAFHECLRAYWFNYYGSWGGWDAKAEPRTRQIYLEKKLTTRAMWTGTVVHGAAEDSLKDACRGATPDLDSAVRKARRKAATDVQDSENGRWRERPAKRVGFAEHYYGTPVTSADWAAAADEIERQIRVLWQHRIFRRLLDVPARILEVEELRRFRVGDAEVYAVLDVLVSDGHGGVVIIDWKTGGAHDDQEIAAQLGVYGLYATQELRIPDDRITALHVNLRHDTETRHPVGPPQIDAARHEIGTHVGEMRSRLTDVRGNVAREEDHPPLPEGDARCTWCSFRRVCGREK